MSGILRTVIPLAAALAATLGACHCRAPAAHDADAGDAADAADAVVVRDGGDAATDARPDGSTPCDDATEIYLPPDGTTMVGSYNVSAHWAVYTDWRTPGMEYREDEYAFDLRSCVEVPVAVFPNGQLFGQIEREEVIYMDAQVTGKGDLYAYDLQTGIRTQLTDTPDDEEWPEAVHYPYLVYSTRVPSGTSPDKGLTLWNRETDERVLLVDHTGAPEGVSISDRYVSWCAYGDWGKDVYYYDLQTGQATHLEATGPGSQYRSSTDGDYLAYMTEDASGRYSTSVYHYSTGEVELIGGGDGWDRMWPIMWKSLVVYKDYSYAQSRYGHGPYDYTITDLDTGVTRRITPPGMTGYLLSRFSSGWALLTKVGEVPGDNYKKYIFVWNLYRMGILGPDDHLVPE